MLVCCLRLQYSYQDPLGLIPLDAAAYRIVRHKRLSTIKRPEKVSSTQYNNRSTCMANNQQAIMALFRLQSMEISEDQILNMVQQMDNGTTTYPIEL
ncbi:MAG: hypothetical protein WCC17_04495 [Candidatus Nitrosopolaris sp.]